MSDTLQCPKCGHNISLSELQSHQMNETLKAKEKEIEADMKKRAFAYAQDEIKKAKQESEESARKQGVEVEFLKKQADESRKKELEFLKKQQEMEMREKSLEIEKEKAIMAERKKIEVELTERVKQEQSLQMDKMRLEDEKRLAEKDKQLAILQKALSDAEQKSRQGSMQIQGEIQENALKEMLSRAFPLDLIDDVATGAKGADLVQSVRDSLGQSAGTIVWESKNTKAWSDGWIDKLKEDRLRVNADVAIIVSTVLPEGVKHFGVYKGIFVTEYAYVLAVTSMLRDQIVTTAGVKTSLVGKDQKMEAIYAYLTSEAFKGKVENIIEAFRALKEDLDSERRAMEKRWKSREQQLERVIGNTAGLYGDLSGIIGKQLPSVEYLELESGEDTK